MSNINHDYDNDVQRGLYGEEAQALANKNHIPCIVNIITHTIQLNNNIHHFRPLGLFIFWHIYSRHWHIQQHLILLFFIFVFSSFFLHQITKLHLQLFHPRQTL